MFKNIGMLMCSILFTVQVLAEEPHTKALQTLEKLFNTLDHELDLARAKILIDRIIDPSLNPQATLNKLNQMAKTVKDAQTPEMTSQDKLLSLSAYLYEFGYWNNNQPFKYDLNDPLGQDLNNKLLSTYLKTKQGNCISMPIMYMLLAEKIGIDNISLSTAPLHVFVKFKDNQGASYNIEATDKGLFVQESFYRNKVAIQNKAINNKVYLQHLSKKESLGVIAILLSEYYERQQQWQASIDVANLILKHYPTYVYAMIKVGNGYQRILQNKLTQVKAKGRYTLEEKNLIDNFHTQNLHWFTKAENLGWLPLSSVENEQYLESVKKRQELNNKQQGKS